MSRGREANTAHVVTGSTAPHRHSSPTSRPPPKPCSRTSCERDAERAVGHRGHPAIPGMGQRNRAPAQPLDRRRPARHTRRHRPAHHRPGSPSTRLQRYQQEHSRQALHAALRAAQLAGHDIHTVIDRITDAPTRRRPVHRQRPPRTPPAPPPPRTAGQPVTWAERTPASAPAVAREIAEALDARPDELGHRHAADPQPWLTRHLGILPRRRLALQRADYERRAGIAAAYREAAGITNPEPGRLTRTAPRQPRTRATCGRKPSANWNIADEAAMWAGMDRGQLEAHTAAAERAQATAPPDVSSRATRHRPR